MNFMKRVGEAWFRKTGALGIGMILISAAGLSGEESALPLVTLDVYEVGIYTPANPVPAGTYAAPITLLRYDPQVDLQVRGFPEAQSDITIRGSVFEHSGVQLGALPLFDPQTGHYTAEIPVDPWMLQSPEVVTGSGNGWRGFNSNAGTLHWRWREISPGARLEAGVGDHGLNFQRVVAGDQWSLRGGDDPVRLGVQAGFSRSEGRGTRPHMEHDFQRYSGRVQLLGRGGQTDLYGAYQAKFYGMPGGYTGNPAFLEADRYRVNLYGINHFQRYGAEESYWEAGVSWRRLVNDYELDRSRGLGFFRPYEHESEVWALGWQGMHHAGPWRTFHRATFVADEIESTELTHADFSSRSYGKVAVLPTYEIVDGDVRVWSLGAGLAYADTNRDRGTLSPLATLSLRERVPGGFNRYFVDYAESAQVPGYTAKSSNPAPGAFAGNPDLERERTRSLETGVEVNRASILWRGVIFWRQDRDLADWTFHSEAASLRQANPVDLDNYGVETALTFLWGAHRFSLGYMGITKSADYGEALVDGSYYAMNYARHRATLAWVYTILEGLEFRADAELRRQSRNIRRTSGRNAFLLSLGTAWEPRFWEGGSFHITVDNVTNSNFQDFPGTPPPRRQVSFSAAYQW